MYQSTKEKNIYDILKVYRTHTPAIYFNINSYIEKSIENTPSKSLIIKKHNKEEILKIKLKALNHPDLIENNKLLSSNLKHLLKKKYSMLNKNA